MSRSFGIGTCSFSFGGACSYRRTHTHSRSSRGQAFAGSCAVSPKLESRKPRLIGIASIDPFGANVIVLSHQRHFRALPVLPELLRRIDRKEHGLVLALVRAVLFVFELDHPHVVVLDDHISSVSHWPPLSLGDGYHST